MIRWREVRSGSAHELDEPLEPDETAIRVLAPPDAAGSERIVAAISRRPDTILWLEDRRPDLGFLSRVPRLRRLHVQSLQLSDIGALEGIPDLVELSLGDTFRPISLRPIESLRNLRVLGVAGTWRHGESIGRLTALQSLTVGAVDLEWLLPLTELRELTSGLGRITHLERLPDVGRLERIELYRVREIGALGGLGAIPTLRHLRLESISRVTSLPSFADSRDLRRIDLDTMKGIRDLRPIAAAPALRYLLLIGMSQLEPGDLRPLVGHPTLVAGIWGLGSDRKNIAAQDLLPLPPEPWRYAEARPNQPRLPSDLPWLEDDLAD